jgi:hypothetical protein
MITFFSLSSGGAIEVGGYLYLNVCEVTKELVFNAVGFKKYLQK